MNSTIVMSSLPVAVKWPYATHRMDPGAPYQVLEMRNLEDPGALVLCRVVTLGKHKDLEAREGRKITLFAGDYFVGVLGNRYATDQFEGAARAIGRYGHILGIGGVTGEVVSMNNRMPDPTVVEWVGRLAGPDGKALRLQEYALPPIQGRRIGSVPTILSLGASMNAGKTTTAAQMIHGLARSGHRVAAAKITGTACLKDPNLFVDAGASKVLDFTHAGFPSTAGCTKSELFGVMKLLRSHLEADSPDFVVIEIADGILQRETTMLLEDAEFRASIKAVTYAGGDPLTCAAGVQRLKQLGYKVLATAGPVANSILSIREAEATTGVPCLDGASILAGGLVETLLSLGAPAGTPAVGPRKLPSKVPPELSKLSSWAIS